MSQTAVWKISLSNLSRNLLEATELANVLQEVSSSIQVTGLSSSLSGRTSTSTSGTPTKLSARERIKNAVPIHIGVGAVPWEQLVAVVPSDALQDDSSFDPADKQPQVVEVNTGGTVFFLFFRLNLKQQQQYQQQQHIDPGRRVSCSSNSSSVSTGAAASPAGVQVDAGVFADPRPAAAAKHAVSVNVRKGLPHEGIAVLKVGFSRLAMQAEQFANELTRHLGIAAPDCRIVRQVGSTADEWTTALDAVNRLAGCSCPPHNTASTVQEAAAATAQTSSISNSSGGSSQHTTSGSSNSADAKLPHVRISSSSGAAQHVIQPSVNHHATSSTSASSSGSTALGAARAQTAANSSALDSSINPRTSSSAGSPADGQAVSTSCPSCGVSCATTTAGPGAAELLGELSHLPCFLLMEFVEGGRLSDSPQALQSGSVGQLLEDVGCLFLLDMLLGNADRMPCADLGWRGNASNLLYGAPGTRHEGRPVAIDSCVARRPPALKASTEDAAVERLAQLLLSVPEVSRSLLQQLLGNIKQDRGRCTRLSLADSSSGDVAGWGEQQQADDVAPLEFSEEDIARFQAGLRKCLHGVTQIKGLLEMVSNKVAEWIADFVADVVKLNPAVLPGPGTPGTPPTGVLRSPRPSPRPSARSLFLQANMAVSGSAGGAGSSGGQPPLYQQQQQQNGLGSIGGAHSPRPSLRSASASNLRLQASSGGGQPPLPLPPPAFQQQQHGLGSNGGLSSPKPSPRSSARSLSIRASTGSGTGSFGGLPPLPTSQQQQLQLEPAADSPSIGVPTAAMGAASALSCTIGTTAHGADAQDAEAVVAAAAVPAGDVLSISCASMDSGRCNTASKSSSSGSPNPHGPLSPTAGPVAESDSAQHSPRRSSSSLSSSSAASDVLSPLSPGAGVASTSSAAQGHAVGPASGSKHSTGGLKFLAKHFSPAGKALPLAKRAASHLGFASIKAAICSTDSSSNDDSPAGASSSTPPALHITPRSHSSSINNSMSGIGSHADVATAVAAALSPKATQAQTQALVGVFGGGAYMGVNGSLSGRRATWNSMDEHHTPTRESPRDLLSAAAAEGSFSGPTDSRRAASCIVPGAPMQSPQRSSNGIFGYQQQQQAAHVSRHSSFPAHSQSVAAAAAAAAATAASPVQQRSSSSSLQVLASIQLDATLASIKHEAKHDGALAERLAHWKAVFREKGAELSEAIVAWQARHHLAAVLSTGFLDGSHPIVDAYELGVRLQHMLRRLTALAAGALVQVPIRAMPGVFLGNAVAADSHHLLHYLGVTHVVNAAQELQVESAPGLFQVHRVAVRDEEEEDMSHHFYQVQALIDSAVSGGGAVLVHCHEGKSRSVALLLAYLMISRGHTLASALAHIRSVRPEACPNAGFMAQLMVLDRQLHGTTSLSTADLPRAKPEARVCSICGQPAGLSYASLVRHMKSRHKVAVAASAVATGSRHAGAASAVSVHTGKAAAAAAAAAAATGH